MKDNSSLNSLWETWKIVAKLVSIIDNTINKGGNKINQTNQLGEINQSYIFFVSMSFQFFVPDQKWRDKFTQECAAISTKWWQIGK